jgi:GntR family transcriptional regulator
MAMTAVQPAFLRVYRALADEISAGRLQAGDRLPSERTLGERLGVSRATVRRAIAELADQGLVETPERRRAFVRGEILSRAAERASELHGARPAAGARRHRAAPRPHDTDRVAARGRGLRDRAGRPLLSLRRLRFLEDRPVAVDEALVPARHRAAPGRGRRGADLAVRRARRRGAEPVRADYDVGAIAVAEPDASLLGVSPGSPGLLAHTRSHSADGRVVEVA